MKKTFPLILLTSFLLSPNLFSQNILIEYQYQNQSQISNYNLTANDTISSWIKISEISNTEDLLDSSSFIMIKDIVNSKIYFNDNVFNKIFDVTDSLYTMKWEINNDKDTILGYSCLGATTFFRGRKYIAKYTPDIILNNGPWKFCGLPGMILEVYSEDKIYHYNAVKIITNYNYEFHSPKIEKSNRITWENFIDLFIDLFDKYIKKIKTTQMLDESSEVGIKVEMPEIIYPKVQSANGIKF